MDTFLKQVAHDLYTKTNGDFAHLAVVFPNKRASLFFNEYLAQEADRPIWSPAYKWEIPSSSYATFTGCSAKQPEARKRWTTFISGVRC